MNKKWNVKLDGRDLEEEEIVESILRNREIFDIDSFLNPKESSLLPSECMEGMDEGYRIIQNTLDNNGKFVIHFDVDLDGTTSGAIITRYLKNFTSNISTYINKGKTHGVESFDLSLLDKNTTMIVVDSLNDIEAYNRILSTGAKLIVCDHHVINDSLKNIKLPFCLISSANNYLSPALSGAGVVFKFCQYMDEQNWTYYADDYWDLAAAGIIGDMCDISDESPENRYICYKGFQSLNNPALKKINGNYKFNSKTVSYGIAPLINAANRMNENEKAMELFLNDDPKQISTLVKDLKKCKERQNDAVADVLDELISQGDSQSDNKCLYFFTEDMDGLSGLIGNKMLEIYKRPLFVLHKKDDNYVGSMRAIGINDFAKMVNETGLGQCMGHELAAGAVIKIENFEEFKIKVEELLGNMEFEQIVDIDILLNPEQITDSLIDTVKKIDSISGNGFPPVTVMVSDIEDFTIDSMSNGKHLRINTPSVTLIKWNFSDWDVALEDIGSVSGIGQLDSSFFGRKYYRQLILNDIEFKKLW